MYWTPYCHSGMVHTSSIWTFVTISRSLCLPTYGTIIYKGIYQGVLMLFVGEGCMCITQSSHAECIFFNHCRNMVMLLPL